MKLRIKSLLVLAGLMFCSCKAAVPNNRLKAISVVTKEHDRNLWLKFVAFKNISIEDKELHRLLDVIVADPISAKRPIHVLTLGDRGPGAPIVPTAPTHMPLAFEFLKLANVTRLASKAALQITATDFAFTEYKTVLAPKLPRTPITLTAHPLNHEDLPGEFAGKYDLILGNDILCTCNLEVPRKTCGGLAISENLDHIISFLRQIGGLLNPANPNATAVVTTSLGKDKQLPEKAWKSIMDALNDEALSPITAENLGFGSIILQNRQSLVR